ncbi:MAG TPA: bifunctional hydroxymethylpyrimidine kinase/phosphomethylpyrimidine kinase [Opitutaceae bacterium]|jgi:hydroxymethylpyrimidine/phosphomethylpyrimidine kinase
MRPPPCILSIAGSDSGGGAGVQADQRTIEALGCHALSAITSVTAQDARSVRKWLPVPDTLIRAQSEATLRGFRVAAAKTGLLPGPGAVRAVALAFSRRPGLPLVVDPVIASTSGTRFLGREGLAALRDRLLPLASLVTPNWPEAEALAGCRIRSYSGAEKVAAGLASRVGTAVLIKGGHGPGNEVCDILATPDGATRWFRSPRIRTTNSHGTGCILSAAIAVWLGRGKDLGEAIRRSRLFVRRALLEGRALDWGGGRGPAFVGGAVTARARMASRSSGRRRG